MRIKKQKEKKNSIKLLLKLSMLFLVLNDLDDLTIV